MPSEQQQPLRPFTQEMQRAANVTEHVFGIFAAGLYPFFRTRIGRNAIGGHGLIAVFLMLIWFIFFPEEDARPMFYYLFAYVGRILARAFHGAIVRDDELRACPHYTGKPILGRFFPKSDESLIKQAVEPIVALVVGIALVKWNEPIGAWIIACAVGMLGFAMIDRLRMQGYVKRMNDSMSRAQRGLLALRNESKSHRRASRW